MIVYNKYIKLWTTTIYFKNARTFNKPLYKLARTYVKPFPISKFKFPYNAGLNEHLNQSLMREAN